MLVGARVGVGVGRGGRRAIGGAQARPRRRPGCRWPERALADIQRSRLLAAAVRAVDELGWANTTVADIVARSRISRRTFYETFANREECLAAVLEDILGVIAGELAERAWRAWGGVSVSARACGRSSRFSTASRCSRGCVWCRR